jgi:hypothetical protein
VIRNVDRLSCVRYGSARYSVPTRLIGATVAVVVDHGAVCLVEPATGQAQLWRSTYRRSTPAEGGFCTFQAS